MIIKEKLLPEKIFELNKTYKPEDISFDKENLIIDGEKYPCKNPRLEFARALSYFSHEIQMYGRNGSWIASNTIYDPRKVKIGIGCVIGDHGFGYEYDENGQLVLMPHLGKVVIEDRVEIRNGVMIDRAVLGDTIIGEGTCIDNLVHVAHGVKIGKNCLIVAGTVIGGSSIIGDNCFLGINCSIKNKVKIGNNVTIGMGAIVTKDVPDGVTVIGTNKILEK